MGDKRIEDIGWGLLLIITGAAFLMPGWGVPWATWLVGVGVVMLGLNAARYLNGIRVRRFTIILGASLPWPLAWGTSLGWIWKCRSSRRCSSCRERVSSSGRWSKATADLLPALPQGVGAPLMRGPHRASRPARSPDRMDLVGRRRDEAIHAIALHIEGALHHHLTDRPTHAQQRGGCCRPRARGARLSRRAERRVPLA